MASFSQFLKELMFSTEPKLVLVNVDLSFFFFLLLFIIVFKRVQGKHQGLVQGYPIPGVSQGVMRNA